MLPHHMPELGELREKVVHRDVKVLFNCNKIRGIFNFRLWKQLKYKIPNGLLESIF